MLTTLLKSIGFGFAAAGLQDHFLEEENGSGYYNLVAMVVGTIAWYTGCVLEKMEAERSPPAITVKKSTAIIQQALSHSAGIGLVTAITHYVKDVDTPSGKIALINMAACSPAAIRELYYASYMPPTIKWEKLRLLVLISSDYFMAAGAKSMMNDGEYTPFTILSLVLGLLFSMSEAAYGIRNDKGLAFQNMLNRRVFKIMAGVNLIFTLQDIIDLDKDKYTIADNVYLTIGSVLLFMTLLELRNIARRRTDEIMAGARLYEEMMQRRVAEEYQREAAGEEKKEVVEARIVEVTELSETGGKEYASVAGRRA